MKNLTYPIFLLLFTLLVSSVAKAPFESTAMEVPLCEIVVGPDVMVSLGEDIRLEMQFSCPPNELVDITWEPMTYLTCENTLCSDVNVAPLSDQCYTVTVNWMDGSSSSEDICVFLEDCNPVFPENQIQNISPMEIDDIAEITLEIARTQFVHIELVDGDDILYTIWEGWLKAGQRAISLDFSTIPAGNYQLRSRFYPEDRFIDIQKL